MDKKQRSAEIALGIIDIVLKNNLFDMQPIILRLYEEYEQSDSPVAMVFYDAYIALRLGSNNEARAQLEETRDAAQSLVNQRYIRNRM